MRARKNKISATSLHDALRLRFAAPEWAYFDEVRNGTGFVRRTTRTADAVAMGLWPSRGLELHGIEIKVHRNDWLRELANPAKADAIGAYCDRWWLATSGMDVAQLDELPPPWGLLVYEEGKLSTVKIAEPLPEVKPLDRLLLASILRRSMQLCEQHVHRADVATEIKTQIAAARAEGKAERVMKNAWAERERQRLCDTIRQFEEASGVTIDAYNGARIGAAVRAVMHCPPDQLRQRYEGMRAYAAAMVRDADAVLASIDVEDR